MLRPSKRSSWLGRLTAAIERASEGRAATTDAIAQRDWIRHDLRGDVRITARVSPAACYVLRGEKLEYRLRRWTNGQLQTWDIAFCEAVETAPRSVPGDNYFSLGIRKLDVELLPTVRNSFATYRDRSSPWDKAFPFSQARRELDPYLKEVHDFFRISQQLDTLLIAAQIWPVTILEVNRSATETEIVVTPFEELQRNDLAQHLALGRPSEQMKEWFGVGAESVVADDDVDPDRDRYNLLERKTIDSDGSPAAWRFRSATNDPKGIRYYFTADAALHVRQGRAYLARNHNGLLSQVRRRHRAIDALH